MWWPIAFALAAPRDPELPTVSWSLRQQLGRADPFSVVVEGLPADALEAAGFEVEAAHGGRVQVRATGPRLRALGALPGVSKVREPWRARAKDEVTEGRAELLTPAWTDEDVDGKGATVGIVDVGFDGLEELPAAEAPDDLVVDDDHGDISFSRHGTAVVEVIHDFAPAASYYVASFSTDVEFCAVMERMVAAGVDVINGSIGFDNVWHADGTSSLTTCADWAGEQGVLYVAAAGNENDRYRVGALSYDADDDVVSLGGAREVRAETSRGNASVSLRWSEDFGRAAEDLDLVLYNEDGGECARSEDAQDGAGDPYEIARGDGCSEWVTAVVVSEGRAATLAGLEGYLYGDHGIDAASWTNVEDLTLPGDTVRGVTVGAWVPEDDTLAAYSSRGPTNDGRVKPDLVAPTGVTTVTFGAGAFEGSSAAAPHVAGLATLWVSASRCHGKGDELKDWLRLGARDLGEAGEDTGFGVGAAQAGELPERCCGCDASGGAAAWSWGLLLALRRRR